MVRSDERRAQLERDLPAAAGRGEIIAAFQAQYSLETGAIVAAEALSRWIHPRFGLISPAEFIPMAERLDLVSGIGDAMLRLGCDAARDWHSQGHPIEVAVNVSILQLRSQEIADTIASLLDELALDAHSLTLEITESMPLADVPPATDTLHTLSELGVNISVDDFGAAHASREQVVALPATELKLDQGLVQTLQGDDSEELASAVEFGKSRRMRVVAEGIETVEQLQRVRALGCDRAQGYLLARPTSKAGMDAMLGSGAHLHAAL